MEMAAPAATFFRTAPPAAQCSPRRTRTFPLPPAARADSLSRLNLGGAGAIWSVPLAAFAQHCGVDRGRAALRLRLLLVAHADASGAVLLAFPQCASHRPRYGREHREPVPFWRSATFNFLPHCGGRHVGIERLDARGLRTLFQRGQSISTLELEVADRAGKGAKSVFRYPADAWHPSLDRAAGDQLELGHRFSLVGPASSHAADRHSTGCHHD